MTNEVVFIDAAAGSRGGLLTSLHVITKETFLKQIEAWNERQEGKSYRHYPSCRYAFVDGPFSQKFKHMSLADFETIFTEEDRSRLGKLLEYGTGYDKYPMFLKAVYLKYGYKGEEE
ncbi:hypothetical protein [Peribacillus muralis]|uniref:hypothetical protein n=1 Tax=Peribacillus muralis TaxID=264697 RepID=UPI00366B2448